MCLAEGAALSPPRGWGPKTRPCTQWLWRSEVRIGAGAKGLGKGYDTERKVRFPEDLWPVPWEAVSMEFRRAAGAGIKTRKLAVTWGQTQRNP